MGSINCKAISELFLFPAKNYIKEMVRLVQIFTLIFMLVSSDVDASPQLLNVDSKASDHGTLVLGRSTGIPGMFGRFTVILNGKVLGMLGENQIIKKRLIPGRYTITIRDDVEYRKFLGTKIRFLINSSQIKYLIVNSEKKAFDSRYRIVVKKVKRD
tara:strand:+ start:181 stop:651 length:471 start_codon:yes stop_codon:yes gene_type:complete